MKDMRRYPEEGKGLSSTPYWDLLSWRTCATSHSNIFKTMLDNQVVYPTSLMLPIFNSSFTFSIIAFIQFRPTFIFFWATIVALDLRVTYSNKSSHNFQACRQQSNRTSECYLFGIESSFLLWLRHSSNLFVCTCVGWPLETHFPSSLLDEGVVG